MTIIKLSYVVSGIREDGELSGDPELPVILYRALGMTFYKFVEITLNKVSKAIKGKHGERLHVRCYRTEKPKVGYCFKSGGKDSVGPDIVLGFCGDIKDLEITLIHELLHLFRWDEKMVEKKAKEIYKGDKHETGKEEFADLGYKIISAGLERSRRPGQ